MRTAPSIGTLTWQPADERSDLVAPPVVPALPPEAWVAAIDPALADTAAFCAAYEVPLQVSANCVVVAGRRGTANTMAACLVLATERADINRVVRKHLDVRKISFAAMDDAVARTGMEYGGITPVGLPGDWPILVDEAVVTQDWVVVGSGVRHSKLALPGPVIPGLPGVVVLPLALPVD